MKIANLSKLRSELTETENTKLSNILNNTVTGSDKVIMSPIAKRLNNDDAITTTYMKFYESLDKSTWPVELLDLEQKQIDKIGPRSIQKPWSERIQLLLVSINQQPLKAVHLVNLQLTFVMLTVYDQLAKQLLLRRSRKTPLPDYLYSCQKVMQLQIAINRKGGLPCCIQERRSKGKQEMFGACLLMTF